MRNSSWIFIWRASGALFYPFSSFYCGAEVKADCRDLLRGAAIHWERAVLKEHKLLQDVSKRACCMSFTWF